MEEDFSSDHLFSSPWDEFRNHPGQVAYVKWNLLRDFYENVVKVNGISLIRLAMLPGTNKKFRRKLLKAYIHGGDLGYDGEIARRLYNYLASVATLVDHCRNVMESYRNEPFYEEYRTKVAEYTSRPESIFIKDLRNYFVHYKVPSLGYSLTDASNPFDDFKTEAVIYISDLNDGKMWSSQSKIYIESHFPHVYISDLIKDHLEGLYELYSFIFTGFSRLHEAEYKESLRIGEKIRKRRE